MLSFDIRSLHSRASAVEGVLALDDPIWEAGDPRPAGPLHVAGRLSAAGPSRFYLSGRLEGQVDVECRRCLKEVTVDVEDDVHVVFAAAGDDEVDDPDVFEFDPQGIDLDVRPAVRESWLLAVPAFAQCSEECKGLCPVCGTDRNERDCGCEPARDARWDALRRPAGQSMDSGSS